jgi:hypothetical protein
LEPAFVGIARQFGKPFAVYDNAKCLAILMEQGLDLESAHEHMSYNVEGAWVGENTPAFLVTAPDEWETQRSELIMSLIEKLETVDTMLRLLLPFVSPASARNDNEKDLCLELLRSVRKILEEKEGDDE